MSSLRVGRISALNMYPVYHHLERAHLPGVEFTDGLPATLKITLYHYDEKSDKNGTDPGNETDLEVVFPVVVR